QVQNIQEDFDSARIYLTRWAMAIAEQSEKDRRSTSWSARELWGDEKTSVGDFELLNITNSVAKDNRNPVTLSEWNEWFDGHGRLTKTVDEVKERIFHGGLDGVDGVRKEAALPAGRVRVGLDQAGAPGDDE